MPARRSHGRTPRGGGATVIENGWTAADVYTIADNAAGGVGKVTYSAKTWHTEDVEGTETKVVDRVVINVTDAPSTLDVVSFKFKNSGAKAIKAYILYAAGEDPTDFTQYPAGEAYVAENMFVSNWSCDVAQFSEFSIATIKLSSDQGGSHGTFLSGKTVTGIALAFDPDEDTIAEERSVEFMGIAFHGRDETPLLNERAIGAPTLYSMTGGSVEQNADGSYTVSYTKKADYARVYVPVFNYTAADKCVTFEFTPYAGMKLGLYYEYEGGDSSVMVKTHTVFPVAEKQTIKFTAAGKVTRLMIYTDAAIEITEMKSFIIHSVTLEERWPVVLTELAVAADSTSIIKPTSQHQKDNYAQYKFKNTGAYPKLVGEINPVLWNRMTPTKYLTISFTPLLADVKIGVQIDGKDFAATDEAGNPVAASHNTYTVNVRKTITFELKDTDFLDGDNNPVAPETVAIFLDAGVTADTERRLTIHSVEVTGQMTIDEVKGDSIHYVKYDPETRETVVTFTSHGVAWWKLTMGVVDYREGYDIVAFRVKADQPMALGIRIEYNDEDQTYNQVRNHALLGATDTEFDLVYMLGEDFSADATFSMYLDAPGYSEFGVDDTTKTTFTIMSVDFLRSADLATPTLTVGTQALSQAYTGENQVIEPQYTCDPDTLSVMYEYLDTGREDAKWSATAPINVGAYKVRLSTVLTREYLSVSDDEHVTLTVTQSQQKRDLPDAAVLFDYKAATIAFSAEVEVSATDTFAQTIKSGATVTPATKYYARYKETDNIVAGNVKTLTTANKAAAPTAFTVDFTASTTTQAVPATVEYSADGANWTAGAGEKLAVTAGATYSFRTAATENAFASDPITLTVPNKPATPALTLKERGTNFIEVNAIEGAEYSIDGVTWQASGRFEGLSADTEYTVRARIPVSSTTFGSDTGSAKFATEAEAEPEQPKGCGCGGNVTAASLGGGLILCLIAVAAVLLLRRKRA